MLAQNHICVLPWPAKLVRSNPIENLWDSLKRKVKARRQPFNLNDLTMLANQVWKQIPKSGILIYIISMRAHRGAEVAARGRYIRY
jgi:hypothetical protein